MTTRTEFLIWSNEHNAWWGPDRRGYVTNRAAAGRYPLVDALRICEMANKYLEGDRPNELLVQDWGAKSKCD